MTYLKNKEWDLVLSPQKSLFDVGIKQLLRYKDLIYLFVYRDFVSQFKQTVLGPLWFFIQPILTTITFTIIFGNIADISTDGMPRILFYLSGIVLWNYFSECVMKTSDTFIANQAIFGKVYFPRIVVPLSIVISCLLKLGVQLLIFLAVFAYYLFATGSVIKPNMYICLLPVMIIIMAGLGLGFGMIISAMTTKYKDLKFLVQFGIQLLMYASPVVYPLSVVSSKYKLFILANPMSSIIELFKLAFLGAGEFEWSYLLYSFCFMVIILFLGVVIFNKVEKSFVDTV